jgi:hypothetical protein
LNKNNPKSVTPKRASFTKPEREYVRGIVHNLSLQRLTDQEIVQWLHDEKQIDLDRSTVSKMRNHVELKAEKWYIELKQSTFKYIAVYKERIDSLFSYQKKLHEIISTTKKPEVQIRAISELHSIEMSIFSLWKQLPALDIVDTNKENEDSTFHQEYQYDNVGRNGLPRAISYGPEEDERQDRAVYFGWKEGDGPLDAQFKASMDEKYGLPNEPWDDPKWIQCHSCKRWFKSMVRLEMHASRYCIPEPIV